MVNKNDGKMSADKRHATGDESAQSNVLKTRTGNGMRNIKNRPNNTSKDMTDGLKAHEDGKVMHYRVFKPNSEPSIVNHEEIGPIGRKDFKMFPVPQLQLPGPAYLPGGFQYASNIDQQQLGGHQQQPVCYPDPQHQQNTMLQSSYSQTQFNPYQYAIEGNPGIQQGHIMPAAMQPIEAFPGPNGPAGYQGHPGQSVPGYPGQNAGYPGYPNLLDPKNVMNSGEQLLTPTYPPWSTQEIAGITPGPPGISPGTLPGVSPGGVLQHQHYGGNAVQGITPSAGANTVFSFPSVPSYNSLCLTPTNQDNRTISFDPSIPPPAPFTGWSRSFISLPESVQNGFPTGPYSTAMLPSVHDPAGYWPQPGHPLTDCSSVSLLPGVNSGFSMDNGLMSLGYAPQQHVPDPLSGQIPGPFFPPAALYPGSYYPTPSLWNNSDDFSNQNVQQFPPQQYYGVSDTAAMPLPSQRSEGADSGVISDFANLTIGDSYESNSSKEDTSRKEEVLEDSSKKDSAVADCGEYPDKDDVRAGNSTPDIVKSVESKVEGINANPTKQAQIIDTIASSKCMSVPDSRSGLEGQLSSGHEGPIGQTYIPYQIQNPGDMALASEGQGATYYTYNPYTAPNPDQFAVQNCASYPGIYPIQNNVQYGVQNYAGQYPVQSVGGPEQYSGGQGLYSAVQPGGQGQYSAVQPVGQFAVQNGLYNYMPVPGPVYYN